MTVREFKRRRAQRAPRSRKAPPRACSRPDAIPRRSNPDVQTVVSAYAISERTGARILAGLNGPPIVHLSAKRIGIRVSDNHQWQASRTQGPAV